MKLKHNFFYSEIKWLGVLFVVIAMLGVGQVASAQTCPTFCYANPFNFEFRCTGNGIAVDIDGQQVLWASNSQISGPLAQALITQQNRFITSGSCGVSLWALKSNELQVHVDSMPDATKRVVSSSICGLSIPVTQPCPSSSSYCGAQPASQLVAQGIAPASTSTGAQNAVIYNQSVQYNDPVTYVLGASESAVVSGSGSGTYHIVQRGETLYRIARRYGTSMTALAAANGISNWNLIYAGQRLIIP